MADSTIPYISNGEASNVPSSKSSPGRNNIIKRIFQKHGYGQLESDGVQEMESLARIDSALPPLPSASRYDPPAISENSTRRSIPRVPVGSKSSARHDSRSCSPSTTTSISASGSIDTNLRSNESANKTEVGEGDDDDAFKKGFGEPPTDCASAGGIHSQRWLYWIILIFALYSTVLSGLWLVVAIIQPRWGHAITGRSILSPTTATTLSALLSKTIEISSVTVFISCLGQMLTRGSLRVKERGMSIGEMTMRNWVFQPGSLITHSETVPKAGWTLLGALTFTATVTSLLYTTASDALVAPKLIFGDWQQTPLKGRYYTSYANARALQQKCPSILKEEDELYSAEACISMQSSGESYRNLMRYHEVWQEIENRPQLNPDLLDQATRPTIQMNLYDNTTAEASWVETANSDIENSFEQYNRTINNVTLAIPHPGVASAAMNRANGIVQPDELEGMGAFSVRAGVVAPALNVLCVNMDEQDLEPLVFTTWPGIDEENDVEESGVGDQVVGSEGWEAKVPVFSDDEFLNRTRVDDVFHWGPEHDRRPPVFQAYPADYNIVVNSTVYMDSSIYMLGKSPELSNYTLCQLTSWLSTDCSTRFDYSGTGGARLSVLCGDPKDEMAYAQSFSSRPRPRPDGDWKWMADAWKLSMDLNGGIYNNNASNARVLTQLALNGTTLLADKPSMAEALAIYASWTLVASVEDSPFRDYWEHEEALLDDPVSQSFNASVRSLEYTSGHIHPWQGIFYAILGLAFILNLFCLGYFIMHTGLITDFTEPQNLFALAMNSPPTAALKGSCGSGPHGKDLAVPWRVAYATMADHYFFKETRYKD